MAGYVFDGVNKVISLTSGSVTLDVRDMYSRWKDYVEVSGSTFLPAFAVTGGDPVDVAQGIYVTSYFFLTNGWRVRPQESNHKLTVITGVLVSDDGSDPFLSTLGAYNVLVQYSQPVRSEVVVVNTGSGLSAEQDAQLTKTLTVPKFLALK